MSKLRKSYPVIVGQNLKPAWNLYHSENLMGWCAYGSLRGALHMGMGDTRNEALADLALRMLGHDEEAWRLKAVGA
jgi:hypothetical protein